MVKTIKNKQKMKKKNLLMTAIAIFGLATITMAQTVPSYVPTTGLVGWWPFTGNANDESGNGNNGTVNGAVLTSDRFSNVNKAYNFDGLSNEISITNPLLNLGEDFTISCWMSSSDITKIQQCLFNSINHTGFVVELNNENIPPNKIMYGVGNSVAFWDLIYAQGTTNNYQNSIWYHVVFLKTGTQYSLFVNNVIDGSSVVSASTSYTQNVGLRIGSIGGMSFFKGNLDDFGIWNRALTATEITVLYEGCALSVTTEPINQSVNISNNAQFTTASSDPLSTYQWQTDLGVGFQNLNNVGQYSGTANDTLTISNTTLSNNNQPFRCIINSGSCSDTSNVAVLTVNNNVGINEFKQDNLFSVYPNPAKSQINVKADAKLLGSVYTVYDNTGKVVLSGKIISDNTVIELGNLSGGIYLFSVGENMKQTFKVIKE
jgi:hypothetical protein